MKISAVDPKIQEVRIDNQRGAGAVPLNQDVDYFGLRVMMRPSTFLRLALPLESDQYVKRMADHIEAGGAIGAPFLSIDIPQAWEQTPPDFAEPAEVKSHDGRHRMMAIRRLEGDQPVEVHLFPRGLRNRDITPEWREALRRSMISQRSHNGVVRGPLFRDASAITEAKEIKACGDCFQAAARNMLNRSDDDISLVHAYVSGQGKLQGRRFLHAWNEQGDTVIDNSNGRNIRLPREIYYAIGNIDPTDSAQYRRYDRQEAVRHMARSRHYGPWDLKESVESAQQNVGDPDSLPSVQTAKARLPQILAAAQRDYDNWDESDRDTYAGGGICHIIADSIVEVLGEMGIEAVPVSCQMEQHVYVAAKFTEGIYSIDIPYHVYEQGGGFSWAKLPDVKFKPGDVVFTRISGDPMDWQNYIDENFADGKKPGRKGLAKRVGVDCRQPVSQLRKIAKSSSGERQRMAHWCANMKAGRQKSK